MDWGNNADDVLPCHAAVDGPQHAGNHDDDYDDEYDDDNDDDHDVNLVVVLRIGSWGMASGMREREVKRTVWPLQSINWSCKNFI